MPIESDHRGSNSPYVARVWRGRTSGVEQMTSIATSTWELVFWEQHGLMHAAVRGPETTASSAETVGDSESFGITFAHGTSMPHLPVGALVDEVVWGGAARVGSRAVQRRVVASTGLTQGAIRQIERAREAAVLLGAGLPALDVVHRLGYYDQPHLARSPQRFIGRTATQLRQPDPTADPLSLLYKPETPARS